MKPVARQDCQINGIYYNAGEEIEVQNKEQLIKLNERGFIEPLTAKEIQDFFKEKTKIIKKEEKKWD